MAHPGRPRGRMNKKTLQAQAELARAQQAQAQAQMQAQRAAAAGQLAPGGKWRRNPSTQWTISTFCQRRNSWCSIT